MDDDDDPHHDDHADNATRHHETRQPVDLLAIQQEIHQTMTSMQLFFDLLRSPPDNHHHDCMVAIKRMLDPMPTTKKTVQQPTQPCTIGEYFTLLHTPTCFVPNCMLNCTDP